MEEQRLLEVAARHEVSEDKAALQGPGGGSAGAGSLSG